MKKQLRIDNLVLANDKVEKMLCISLQYPFLNTIEYGVGAIDWDNIKPIPLTTGWLLKFGFVNRFGQDYTIGDLHPKLQKRDMYVYKNDKGFFYEDFRRPIKHVHQLQNLYFALTGEELKLQS